MYGSARSQGNPAVTEGGGAVAGENSRPDGVRATVLQNEDGGGTGNAACKRRWFRL
ncbi:hypothetical protein Bca4012_101948 [Brassica carinata]